MVTAPPTDKHKTTTQRADHPKSHVNHHAHAPLDNGHDPVGSLTADQLMDKYNPRPEQIVATSTALPTNSPTGRGNLRAWTSEQSTTPREFGSTEIDRITRAHGLGDTEALSIASGGNNVSGQQVSNISVGFKNGGTLNIGRNANSISLRAADGSTISLSTRDAKGNWESFGSHGEKVPTNPEVIAAGTQIYAGASAQLATTPLPQLADKPPTAPHDTLAVPPGGRLIAGNSTQGAVVAEKLPPIGRTGQRNLFRPS